MNFCVLLALFAQVAVVVPEKFMGNTVYENYTFVGRGSQTKSALIKPMMCEMPKLEYFFFSVAELSCVHGGYLCKQAERWHTRYIFQGHAVKTLEECTAPLSDVFARIVAAANVCGNTDKPFIVQFIELYFETVFSILKFSIKIYLELHLNNLSLVTKRVSSILCPPIRYAGRVIKSACCFVLLWLCWGRANRQPVRAKSVKLEKPATSLASRVPSANSESSEQRSKKETEEETPETESMVSPNIVQKSELHTPELETVESCNVSIEELEKKSEVGNTSTKELVLFKRIEEPVEVEKTSNELVTVIEFVMKPTDYFLFKRMEIPIILEIDETLSQELVFFNRIEEPIEAKKTSSKELILFERIEEPIKSIELVMKPTDFFIFKRMEIPIILEIEETLSRELGLFKKLTPRYSDNRNDNHNAFHVAEDDELHYPIPELEKAVRSSEPDEQMNVAPATVQFEPALQESEHMALPCNGFTQEPEDKIITAPTTNELAGRIEQTETLTSSQKLEYANADESIEEIKTPATLSPIKKPETQNRIKNPVMSRIIQVAAEKNAGPIVDLQEVEMKVEDAAQQTYKLACYELGIDAASRSDVKKAMMSQCPNNKSNDALILCFKYLQLASRVEVQAIMVIRECLFQILNEMSEKGEEIEFDFISPEYEPKTLISLTQTERFYDLHLWRKVCWKTFKNRIDLEERQCRYQPWR